MSRAREADLFCLGLFITFNELARLVASKTASRARKHDRALSTICRNRRHAEEVVIDHKTFEHMAIRFANEA